MYIHRARRYRLEDDDVCGDDDTRLLRIRHATDFRIDFLCHSHLYPFSGQSHRVSDNNNIPTSVPTVRL